MTVGRLFHLIHMTGDLPALESWYDQVLSVRRGFIDHSYLELEKRDASLVLLGDTVLEPLAPAFRVPGWDTMPLGRFYHRFGNHWHSIAWYLDGDAGDIWQRCVDAGVRVFGNGGRPIDTRPAPETTIITHPKDTCTQLEFMRPSKSMRSRDPRLNGTRDWDPNWWVDNHPLGSPGLAYTTVLTADRARAETIYADVLGGTVLHKGSSTLTGTDDTYVQLGDTVVQLSTPNTDGTLAAADMAANKEVHHAVAFRVRDLDTAEEYLSAKGVKTLSRTDDTLLTDPATTHGAPFRWTTWDVPGGPRDGS